MSIRAVCWLQSKLGLDIGGRSFTDDGKDNPGSGELAGFSTTQNRSYSTDPVSTVNRDAAPNRSGAGIDSDGGTFPSLASGWESKLGQVWKQASDKATQYWSTNVRRGAGNDPFGFGSERSKGNLNNITAAGDNPELDENGLPLTRNWYYYDTQLGRWTVSGDAPESVQREYYAKLEEAEEERLGQKKVAPPPPASVAGGPPTLLGATVCGHGSQSPQYAIPDYFGSSGATGETPQQLAPTYGVYGGAPAQHVQSIASGASPPTAMSTYPGAYYPLTPPTFGTPALATTQATTYPQPLSAHSQVSPPPLPPQAYLPAMPSISVPSYNIAGGAYPTASAPPMPSTHALPLQPLPHTAASEKTRTSIMPPTSSPTFLASPLPSQPPAQQHAYLSPAPNGISASPLAPAPS
ncbi:hypothetical protein, conserved [Leishmania tarentolae]|uniref:Uncharacterized protein n=1 Tax=Leishmania tarentolae TaxID=5689 RepID=A0A640KL65_LEITA|nr:hypothetical protein, conserved [Leishmania tarentolae]